MKKLTALLLALVVLSTLGGALAAEKTYRVGIAQFAVHGSLDNCREGFIQGLADAGFKEGVNLVIEYQNAQADMGIAAAIAAAFVKTQVDLICAIATPMAVVSNNASDGKIPVIYSAVSSPEGVGLTNQEGLGEGKITGTSDKLNVRKQLEVIRALQPEAKIIGILYTLGEINSQVQLKEYQDLAPEYGFSIEPSGIATGADIALAVPALLKKVDLITMLTDNTVVQYLDVVLDIAEPLKIPIYGSEEEQVVRGCAAAEGLDYFALGLKTGELAARVLKGEDPATIPYVSFRESKLFYNLEVMSALGLSLSEDLATRGTDVTTLK